MITRRTVIISSSSSSPAAAAAADMYVVFLVLYVLLACGHIAAAESAETSPDASYHHLSTSSANVFGSHTDDKTFRDARCRVRCLVQLQMNNEVSSTGGDYSNGEDDGPHASLEDCRSNAVCSACLVPCNRPLSGLSSCQDNCLLTVDEDTESCSESCRFLNQINEIRPGTCPPETQATGNAAVCQTVCRVDADCAEDPEHKCCSNSCGWTCQRPSHMYDGMPNVPGPPTTRERFPDAGGAMEAGGVEVSWTSVMPNNTGPLLYAVQLQQHVIAPVSAGHHPQRGAGATGTVPKQHTALSLSTDGVDSSSSVSTRWLQVTQVAETSAVLGYDVIKPGRWYQFRVAAVNVYGSQGWSRPSVAFTSNAKPKKPGPPLNVTLGDRMVADGRVSITIHWSPPSTTDMPVSRYKLYWSKRSGSHVTNTNSNTIREYRQVLPSDRLSFTVSALDLDSTYFFQIQAIAQYGDVKLKSERTSVIIETGVHHSQSRDHNYRGSLAMSGMTSQDIDDDDDIVVPPFTLFAEKPFYENGNLKVNITWSNTWSDGPSRNSGIVSVQWSPEACIADAQTKDGGLTKVMSASTMEKFYVIHDLRFDCRYIVRVERAAQGHNGGHGQGQSHESAHIVVITPSCGQIHVLTGHQRPECPGISALPLVPREPRDLQHSFIISNSNNITARLSWLPPYDPSNTVSALDVPLTGYRIKWGQIVQTDPIQMDSAALTKVLSKDARELHIGGLSAATTYFAQIQSLGVSGAASHMTSILFTTPLLQTNVNDRPHGDQSNTEHTPRRDRPSERRHRRPHESPGLHLATNGFAASSSVVVVTMATPLSPASGSVTRRTPATIDLSPRSNSPHRSGAVATYVGSSCCLVTIATLAIVAMGMTSELHWSIR